MSSFPKIVLLVLVYQLGTAIYPVVHAQDHAERKKFYAGVEMGVGSLKLSQNYLPAETDSRFAMGFYGGYCPFRWLRVGLNLNGWLIEPFDYFNDPAKGISIGNTYGQIEVFPFKRVNLFLNLQGGISTYTNKHPDEYNAKGTGTKFGLGYEYDAAKHLGLSLTVNYGVGRFNDVLYPPPVINQHYNTIEFLLGITYH